MRIIDCRVYESRWNIVFSDQGSWRAGIYVPENSSRKEIRSLEKHDKPELFVLLEGEIVLVLSQDGLNVLEVPMEPGKIYVVEEWHNAYSPRGSRGKALVIEAEDIKTEYLSL